MSDLYSVLELEKIFNSIAELAQSNAGAKEIMQLNFYKDYSAVLEEQNFLKEATAYLGSFLAPILNIPEIELYLEQAEKGRVLAIAELYLVRLATEIFKNIENAKELNNFPLLAELKKIVYPLNSLSGRLSIILSEEEVDDRASSKLKSIRSKKKVTSNKVASLLETLLRKHRLILQEEQLAFKDNLLLLPLKISHKNALGGTIHYYSSSGLTAYVEPAEAINLNRELLQLIEEEKEEIIQIRKELSTAIASQVMEILTNYKLTIKLDIAFAKALWGLKNHYYFPQFSENYFVKVTNAAHPLIDKDVVVSNSYKLSEKQKVIIISGPNAGGKTVLLKTIALMSYLGQCGLPLPIDEAELTVYQDIIVDIGDGQSILNSLSSFSSHVISLKKIIERKANKALILIDEIARGTDPLEGEALAISIIDYLMKSAASLIVTTHYSNLKQYALSQSGIISGSMEFDTERFLPSFHFRQGQAGASYAFDIAKNLGIRNDIIEAGKRKYQENMSESHRQALILKEKITLQELEILKIKEQEKQLESLRVEKEQELKDLALHKEKLKAEAEAEIALMVSQAKEQIAEKMVEVKPHEVKKVYRQLEAMIPEEQAEIVHTFAVGDFVLIKSLGQKGHIVKMLEDSAIIDSGFIKLTADLSDLEPAKKVVSSKNKGDDQVYLKNYPLELNIIGFRVEEGLEELARYLDGAIKNNLQQVRIIHGIGTGKLRSAVHQLLKRQKQVVKYYLDSASLSGATIVELK